MSEANNFLDLNKKDDVVKPIFGSTSLKDAVHNQRSVNPVNPPNLAADNHIYIQLED